MIEKPSRKPTIGERTMNTAIVWSPDPIKEAQPELATAAPAIPPTRACEELVGRPAYHVRMSQAIAPMRPAKMTPLDRTS